MQCGTIKRIWEEAIHGFGAKQNGFCHWGGARFNSPTPPPVSTVLGMLVCHWACWVIGGSDSSWTPFVLFRVACARRGGVPRQTCNFPWVFLWVVEVCIVWYGIVSRFCVGFRNVLACLFEGYSCWFQHGTSYHASLPHNPNYQFPPYRTNVCNARTSKTILPNLPFPTPFSSKTSWKPYTWPTKELRGVCLKHSEPARKSRPS